MRPTQRAARWLAPPLLPAEQLTEAAAAARHGVAAAPLRRALAHRLGLVSVHRLRDSVHARAAQPLRNLRDRINSRRTLCESVTGKRMAIACQRKVKAPSRSAVPRADGRTSGSIHTRHDRATERLYASSVQGA